MRQGIAAPRPVGLIAWCPFVKLAEIGHQRGLAEREKILGGPSTAVSAVESRKRGKVNCPTVERINFAPSDKLNRSVRTSSMSDISVRTGSPAFFFSC